MAPLYASIAWKGRSATTAESPSAMYRSNSRSLARALYASAPATPATATNTMAATVRRTEEMVTAFHRDGRGGNFQRKAVSNVDTLAMGHSHAGSVMKEAGALGWVEVGHREAALIERCAAGEPAACAELVSGHERIVFERKGARSFAEVGQRRLARIAGVDLGIFVDVIEGAEHVVVVAQQRRLHQRLIERPHGPLPRSK